MQRGVGPGTPRRPCPLGRVMPSTASSVSLSDAVCSCLISCARHGDAFPGSVHTGGSWAPFQTQHPLEAGFEKQPLYFHHRCLCGALSFWGER